MLTFFDYANIAFYVLFIVGVGFYYSRKSTNTSDYFRGGGVMPWWITGAAAWMGSFSAWTFTGAAGKIYDVGPYVLCLYFAGLPALAFLLGYTCYRFRRMRVVTPLEAVRLRFGNGSQQFYTWIRLPLLVFFGGVALNSVSVFMSAVFGVDITTMLVALGVIVLVVSMLGGTFAVAASDFVQMFLVVTVTIVTTVLALNQDKVGGLAGLVERVPKRHFEWGQIANPGFIFLWFLALSLNNLFSQNSMDNSAKYLMTRSDRHARLMLIIPIIGTLLGPLIWIIPPMVTAVTHPNLAGEFQLLHFPQEAAFLATALDVLPNGMLGLLICGIFAATLTGMDASLNQAAGIYVRNFHLPIINPACSEKRLLLISKACTAIFGTLIILIAIVFNRYRNLGLFDLLNQLGVSLWLPLAIPLCLGLFYKRTPAWSTWSTVLLGLATALGVNRLLSTSHWTPIADTARYSYSGPDWIAALPGINGQLLKEETISLTLILTVGLVACVCAGWFFFTSLFYERSSMAYKASVEEFFVRLRQPMGTRDGEEVKENLTIELSIGRLCLIYGVFVILMASIPNPLSGRLAFVFCGGVMALTGWLLVRHYTIRAAKPAVAPVGIPAEQPLAQVR
jgi:Na+/proline symporter